MPPQFPDDDAIARLAEAFMDLSLPRVEWTHAAHFATAIYIFKRRPDLDAARDMPGFIRAYNAHVGGPPDGYHETITQASLRAARSELSNEPLTVILDRVLLRFGDKTWILTHWRRETLFSDRARLAWLDPDLQPLPF